MGLATVAAASWSISIQMPSGLLTKVSINVLFLHIGQLEFGFSFLSGELEYIEPEGKAVLLTCSWKDCCFHTLVQFSDSFGQEKQNH